MEEGEGWGEGAAQAVVVVVFRRRRPLEEEMEEEEERVDCGGVLFAAAIVHSR